MLKPKVSRAFWDDADVGLTLTEFKIVHLLAANVGSYVTYRSVYDCMHYVGFIAGSGENGYRTNVRSCIKRIRNKFRAIDPTFAEIDNYQSFGYRWGKT
jgi:two-component system response regulator ChvI